MPNRNAFDIESLVSTTQLTRTVEPPLPVTIRTSLSTEKFTLTGGTCVVGSGADANYIVADKTVSRRHVSLQLEPAGVRVIDLGSTNGTGYLGHRVSDLVLSTNGKLRLGRAMLDLEFELSPLSEVDMHRASAAVHAEPPSMQQLYGLLKRLEGSLMGVLLTGESATGKRFVARTVHEHSMVSSGPLVTVDCGGLDREFLRSELFGHRDGTNTRATECRVSAFARADGGTLLLDEIDELPLDVQSVLLRILQERELLPFAERNRHNNVRLIATADRDLVELVRQGKFREELYHQLNVLRVQVPPLGQRREVSTPPHAAGAPANADRRARRGYARA
jgi:hypothetical protein